MEDCSDKQPNTFQLDESRDSTWQINICSTATNLFKNIIQLFFHAQRQNIHATEESFNLAAH